MAKSNVAQTIQNSSIVENNQELELIPKNESEYQKKRPENVPEQRWKIVLELEEYLTETKQSVNKICNPTQLNVSGPTISAWKKGVYNGNNEQIDKAVKKFLYTERVKRYKVPTTLEYVELDSTSKIMNVLKTTLRDGLISCVTGDSGTGKTTAINQFIKKYNVILIEANRTFRNPFEYLKNIHNHPLVGARHKMGTGRVLTQNEMFENIVEAIKGKVTMIIVDQCDYLSLKAIDVIRSVNDKAGVGICFVGLPSFQYTLKGDEPEVRQVRDRIILSLRVAHYSLEDCKLIIKNNLPGGIHLYDKFYSRSKESIRVLSTLIYLSHKLILSNKTSYEEITEEVIEEASNMI